MRIELAKLLLQNNDLMLLDEPTNHLDIDYIIWLENFLKNYPGAIVLVSHDKQFMTTVCNRTFDINNKKIDDYKANYSKYLFTSGKKKNWHKPRKPRCRNQANEKITLIVSVQHQYQSGFCTILN